MISFYIGLESKFNFLQISNLIIFIQFTDENDLEFDCCELRERGTDHPLCAPIIIPDDDPLYSPFGKRCHDFKRSVAGHRPNCALGK